MNAFGIRRTWRLVRFGLSELRGLAGGWIPRALLFLVVYCALSVFLNSDTPREQVRHLFTSGGMLALGALVLTALFFVGLCRSNASSMGWLLLPASKMEKYVAFVLTSMLSWLLLYVLCMLLAVLFWGAYSLIADPGLFVLITPQTVLGSPERVFADVTILMGLLFLTIVYIESDLRKGWLYVLAILALIGMVCLAVGSVCASLPLWFRLTAFFMLWMVIGALAVKGYQLFGRIQFDHQTAEEGDVDE